MKRVIPHINGQVKDIIEIAEIERIKDPVGKILDSKDQNTKSY